MRIDFTTLNSDRDGWPAEIKEWLHRADQSSKDRPPIILEVSGLDSLAAAIMAGAENHGSRTLIPCVAVAPTEYGNQASSINQIDSILQKALGNSVLQPSVQVRDFFFWSILNGNYIPSIIEAFGFYSPCVGCHAYVHSLRILLAKLTGADIVVSGERLCHDQVVKINQTEVSIAAHRRLFASSGIKLQTPILNVSNKSQLKEIVGNYDKELEVRCVFNSKIRDRRNTEFAISKLSGYYENYVLPAAQAYVSWKESNWESRMELNRNEDLVKLIEQQIKF